MVRNIQWDLQTYQADCVDAFRMECSKDDIKNNKAAKKMMKYINSQGRKIDRIVKLYRKIMQY